MGQVLPLGPLPRVRPSDDPCPAQSFCRSTSVFWRSRAKTRGRAACKSTEPQERLRPFGLPSLTRPASSARQASCGRRCGLAAEGRCPSAPNSTSRRSAPSSTGWSPRHPAVQPCRRRARPQAQHQARQDHRAVCRRGAPHSRQHRRPAFPTSPDCAIAPCPFSAANAGANILALDILRNRPNMYPTETRQGSFLGRRSQVAFRVAGILCQKNDRPPHRPPNVLALLQEHRPCTPCPCADLLRANSLFLGRSSLRSTEQGIHPNLSMLRRDQPRRQAKRGKFGRILRIPCRIPCQQGIAVGESTRDGACRLLGHHRGHRQVRGGDRRIAADRSDGAPRPGEVVRPSGRHAHRFAPVQHLVDHGSVAGRRALPPKSSSDSPERSATSGTAGPANGRAFAPSGVTAVPGALPQSGAALAIVRRAQPIRRGKMRGGPRISGTHA
jgi:hypothetical protein